MFRSVLGSMRSDFRSVLSSMGSNIQQCSGFHAIKCSVVFSVLWDQMYISVLGSVGSGVQQCSGFHDRGAKEFNICLIFLESRYSALVYVPGSSDQCVQGGSGSHGLNRYSHKLYLAVFWVQWDQGVEQFVLFPDRGIKMYSSVLGFMVFLTGMLSPVNH